MLVHSVETGNREAHKMVRGVAPTTLPQSSGTVWTDDGRKKDSACRFCRPLFDDKVDAGFTRHPI
jgi:hypothetical protein